MAHPMDDVVVVLPGIMGSRLWRKGAAVWEPSGGAVVAALTSLLRSVKSLQLPDGVGDDHPVDGVEAAGLMPDLRLPFGIWTFDLGYDALLGFLRTTFDLVEAPPGSDRPAGDRPANLVVFPYDWRLSNRYNGERLRCVAEQALERWRGKGGRFADAKLVFIAHSMGGLVARWYLNHLGGAALTRKLITLGTPHRGSLTNARLPRARLRTRSWPGLLKCARVLSGLAGSEPRVFSARRRPALDDAVTDAAPPLRGPGGRLLGSAGEPVCVGLRLRALQAVPCLLELVPGGGVRLPGGHQIPICVVHRQGRLPNALKLPRLVCKPLVDPPVHFVADSVYQTEERCGKHHA